MDNNPMSGAPMQPSMPPHSGEKFSLNWSGIDWKKEFMNAIEILKMNKVKMQEVAKDPKATTVGFTFIVGSSVLSYVLTMLLLSKWYFGWQSMLIPSLISLVTPFLAIWAIHFTATKFFQGKGELVPFFRVLSYVQVVALLSPVVVILSFISWGLASLAGLVTLAAGIWALVVSYHALMEMYKLNSQNTVITLVVAIVAVGIVVALINNFLMPKPEDIYRDAFKNYFTR